MTNVWMNWEDLTLKASGHAGAGVNGSDIVCAGISALTQALLNTLMDAEERGRIRLEWSMDEVNGGIRMKASPNAGYRKETEDYYRVIMTGLKAIREHYPENIKIGEVWTSGNL